MSCTAGCTWPVSTIAGRAGVADGTIYLYFKSKEAILVAIFARAMQRFNDAVQPIVARAGASADGVPRAARNRWHVEPASVRSDRRCG